jgi:hypothetical protein
VRATLAIALAAAITQLAVSSLAEIARRPEGLGDHMVTAQPRGTTSQAARDPLTDMTERELIGALIRGSLWENRDLLDRLVQRHFAPILIAGEGAGPGDTGAPGGHAGEPETDVAASARDEAIATLEQLRATIDEMMTGGYRGELISEEMIDGDLLRKHLNVWFRLRPRGVRLEFISPDEGQVVVWQQGWSKMVVDRPWLPALRIDPAGERALATGHRPVTTFGIDLTIDRYLDALRRGSPDGEFEMTHVGEEQAGRQTLDRWDFRHPAVGGSPVTGFSVWLDPSTGLPVHFENRRADGSIYERYRYLRFEVNPQLDGDLFED